MERHTRDKESTSRGFLRKAEIERMMSNGSVANVAVMVGFILQIDPQMVTTVEIRHWLAAWLGFTFGAHMRREKDER